MKSVDPTLYLCIQCRKCGAGCPVSKESDISPYQVVHSLRMGMVEPVLESRMIWLCSLCGTCNTRCPQGVNIMGTIENCRNTVLSEKINPGIPAAAGLAGAMLASIERRGRVYELGIVRAMKETKEILREFRLGLKMLYRGRLKLFPSSGDRQLVKKILQRTRERSGSNTEKEGNTRLE